MKLNIGSVYMTNDTKVGLLLGYSNNNAIFAKIEVIEEKDDGAISTIIDIPNYFVCNPDNIFKCILDDYPGDDLVMALYEEYINKVKLSLKDLTECESSMKSVISSNSDMEKDFYDTLSNEAISNPGRVDLLYEEISSIDPTQQSIEASFACYGISSDWIEFKSDAKSDIYRCLTGYNLFMKFGVSDCSSFFGVSRNTIYGWLGKNKQKLECKKFRLIENK